MIPAALLILALSKRPPAKSVKKMVTTVFTIAHDYSIFTRWRKVTIDDKICVVPKSSPGGGVCSGMTVTWLKKSLSTNGRGIKSFDELGSPHLMAIVQGAFAETFRAGKTRLDVIDSVVTLLTTQNLTTWEYLCGTHQFDTKGIVIWASLRPCHCIFAFVDRSAKNGHTIGIRCEEGILEVFDSNKGLFQYPDPYSCSSYLETALQNYYPKCLGGNWGIFRVK